jgi:hypothetical protein
VGEGREGVEGSSRALAFHNCCVVVGTVGRLRRTIVDGIVG